MVVIHGTAKFSLVLISPEPSTFILLGTGLMGVLGALRKLRR